MVDRRTILKLGATSAAGALINLPEAAFGAAAPAPPQNSIHRAMFDGRSPEALAFAAELTGRGVATSEVTGDIGQLWYGDLQSQLLHAPMPIAGLTDRATLFCLEELARSVGMKVRYRVEHHIHSGGHVQHDAVGPASIVDAASKLSSRSGFGREMAVAASQFDTRESGETDAQKRTGPFSPADKAVLVSWVIA
jgi:hypothetical protein